MPLLAAARRRWSMLLAVALLVGAFLPAGLARAVPPAQLTDQPAIVNGDEDLNVRAGPGLDEPIVGSLAPGTEIVILSGPVAADGWNWCQHNKGGWSVCEPLVTPQGVSVLYAAGGGGGAPAASAAAAPAPAAPAAPPAAAAQPTAAATPNPPPRPQPPVQTAVSLPLPGGTPLVPSPTIRVVATPTISAPRPPAGVGPTGVGGTPTPISGLPQPPPGLVPGAPSSVGGAVGTSSPTPLVRPGAPTGPGVPGQPVPGQPVPGQVAPGQTVPGQTIPGQVAPGQVPVAPGQVALTPGAIPATPASQPNFLPR